MIAKRHGLAVRCSSCRERMHLVVTHQAAADALSAKEEQKLTMVADTLQACACACGAPLVIARAVWTPVAAEPATAKKK